MEIRSFAGLSPIAHIVTSLALLVLCAAAFGQAITDEIGDRSVVSAGDTGRIERLMARSLRGGKATLAVIGGSITQGAMATQPAKRYGDLVGAWWKQQFPRAKTETVNAGIGATGSNYGALRAQRDLLRFRPDLIVVEYAVNDPDSQDSAETLEGLVRQILKQPQKPAVILLFMMNDQGGNAQAWLSRVGRHYNLPMISYRDAFWPEIESGRLQRKALFFDMVHPNDAGHAVVAGLVTRFLQRVRDHGASVRSLPPLARVPAPLLTDIFEHVKLLEAADLVPIRNDGWTLDTDLKCWKTDRMGAVLELEAPGTRLCSMSYRVKGPMGQARFQVDDLPPVTVDGWFDQTWGGYQTTDVIGRELRPGKHRVRIEIVGKNPGSTGFEYRLFGLGAAGVGR